MVTAFGTMTCVVLGRLKSHPSPLEDLLPTPFLASHHSPLKLLIFSRDPASLSHHFSPNLTAVFCSLFGLSACNLKYLIDFFTQDLKLLFLVGEGNLSLTKRGFTMPTALPYGKKLTPACQRRVSHARNVFLFLFHPPLFHFLRQQ